MLIYVNLLLYQVFEISFTENLSCLEINPVLWWQYYHESVLYPVVSCTVSITLITLYIYIYILYIYIYIYIYIISRENASQEGKCRNVLEKYSLFLWSCDYLGSSMSNHDGKWVHYDNQIYTNIYIHIYTYTHIYIYTYILIYIYIYNRKSSKVYWNTFYTLRFLFLCSKFETTETYLRSCQTSMIELFR